ncbi:hypothetical protein MJN47_29390, partial [Salmonella enterica subsp. enterica serovar Lubbock]|nr:hypothetical protein [Salmonella enterica subsp. enterica serovar Lubbock]
ENPHYFQAWQKGETGYPIVDAAMRQLNATGWMHNRLRMITARGEGWEGGVPLFLDEQSHQFLQTEDASPYNYIANMPKSEYDEA